MKFMHLLSLLSLSLLWDSATSVLVNSTYDDSSPAIIYGPSDAHWFLKPAQICSQCPSLDMAINSTYHYGSHFVPEDADSDPVNGTSGSEDSDTDMHDDANWRPDAEAGDSGSGGDGGRKRILWRKDGPNDRGFIDTSVNATLTFNGIGVYVYCIVPIRNDNNASSPLVSNMTFTLDGVLVNSFVHHPSDGPSSRYNFSQLVFASFGLMNGQHTIMISPQLGSMIMLDAINVTSDGSDVANQNGTNTNPSTKKSSRDVETFAIAIGSTTGLLAILSFIVAASICTRRRRSAKREKSREAREVSLCSEMRSPQQFVPRYFPGTIVASRSNSRITSPNSSASRRTSQSSMGPSHGLDYPLAPEIPGPSYSPVTIAEIQPPFPISIALRATVVRLPDDDDVVPPSYQEVGQTSLLPTPVFDQRAPSFLELSPTQYPLVLSSSEAILGDLESTDTFPMRLPGIPLMLDEDEDVSLESERDTITQN